MTKGKSTGLILRFSAPLVIGNLLQQLYSFIDAAIIGNFVGVNALAAVGCTSWVIWLLLAIGRDYSNAYCIAASVRIGADRLDEYKKIVANSAMTGVLLSACITAALTLNLDVILHLMNIPANIYPDAKDYLMIYTLGMPLLIAFNTAAAMLRAAGNSSISMYAMTASTITNIVLDLVFVTVFHWGVKGAAVATLIAQGVAAGIAIAGLVGKEPYRTSRRHWRLDLPILKEVGKLWMPMFWNSLIISFGGLYTQKCVNALGSEFAAGIEAGSKIFSLMESVVMAIQAGTCIFVGQNLGAEQYRRIRKGVSSIIFWATGITAVMIACVWLFGDRILDLFLSQKDPAVYLIAARTARRFVCTLTTSMLIMTPMYLYRATLQTLGHPNYAMIAGCLQVVARILTVELLPPLLGEYTYYLTDVSAWIVTLPTVLIPYLYYIRRLQKREPEVSVNGSGIACERHV